MSANKEAVLSEKRDVTRLNQTVVVTFSGELFEGFRWVA